MFTQRREMPLGLLSYGQSPYVPQLGHHFRAVSRGSLSHVPPLTRRTRRGKQSIQCPRIWSNNWCLQSDVTTNPHLQAAYAPDGTGAASHPSPGAQGSGLDNGPTVEGVPFNLTGLDLQDQYDAGFTGLFLMDTKAQLGIAELLGRAAQASELRRRLRLVNTAMMYGNFDVIIDHFSHISQLYATLHVTWYFMHLARDFMHLARGRPCDADCDHFSSIVQPHTAPHRPTCTPHRPTYAGCCGIIGGHTYRMLI